jgi:hypothetical protein
MSARWWKRYLTYFPHKKKIIDLERLRDPLKNLQQHSGPEGGKKCRITTQRVMLRKSDTTDTWKGIGVQKDGEHQPCSACHCIVALFALEPPLPIAHLHA